MERVLEIALLFAVISLCFGYIALFVAENDQNVSQNTTTKSKEQFQAENDTESNRYVSCLLYTSPSPRDRSLSRMPSSA